ncbi:MAG: hypothetical protein KDA84_15205, partial [Planctomycetaceae bacterium]|nr:hypothetical protein [Planctomycetaceae bacterium]
AKVAQPKGRVAKLLAAKASDEELIRELYLVTLGRPPLAEERAAATAIMSEGPTRKEAAEDILWVLLNSTEFVFNH